ncbi:MAG: hypothetical protein H0Z38_09415, partial [Firmicutes bacterium]|nr:hypothetical protein [Bacillota bacterium]
MYRIPFSFYDFVSYLSTGFVLLFSLDSILETQWVQWEHLDAAGGIFLLVLVYLIGHLTAHLASEIFEKHLLALVGRPSDHLFQEKPTGRWPTSYTRPFPAELRVQILAKYARSTDSKQPGESMFLYCFHKVKDSSVTYERLTQFLSLYGFARNMSFTLFVVGLAALVQGISTGVINGSLLVGCFGGSYL